MERRSRGLTVIELMVVVAILAVLSTIAAPSFQRMLDRHRLQAAANQLKADLLHMRSESVRRGESLYLTPTLGTNGSCYVLHPGKDACQCAADGSSTCSAGVQPLRVATFPIGRTPQLTAFDSGNSSYVVHPRIGVFGRLGTLYLSGQDTRLGVTVSNFRARVCTPDVDCPP